MAQSHCLATVQYGSTGAGQGRFSQGSLGNHRPGKAVVRKRQTHPEISGQQAGMNFRIISAILEVQIIASGKSIRDRKRLVKFYGGARWRKMKGIASIQSASGRIALAELHWYEAHGIGKKEIKIKRIIS